MGQLGLFEHDVDFLHVGARQRIQVDHGNILDFRFGDYEGGETIGRE
jgi:hypothetical protein